MKLYAAYIQNFNSIKVRLKPQMKCLMSSCETFQFHKGTIKTNVCVFDGTASLHFNSIKVRLKLIKVLIYALGLIFQFHKGTIKTKFPKRDKSGAVVFQFHKGTIKTTR